MNWRYSGISIIQTPLGPYQTVLIIEVSLVWRLVASMHSLASHTPQSTGITETTQQAKEAKRRSDRE